MAECKLKRRSCSYEQNVHADKPERNIQKRGMRIRAGPLILCEGARGEAAARRSPFYLSNVRILRVIPLSGQLG
jgi:hypothetical protein